MSDRSASILATSIILLVLLFIFVPARLAAREATRARQSAASTEGAIGLDDWVALAAGVGSSLGCGLLIAATYRGLGQHTDPTRLSAIQQAMQLIFVDQIIYIIVMSLTKTSQLLLYTRLWSTPAQESFRVCCYGVMVLNWIITIFLIPYAITSCNPPQRFWTRISHPEQGMDCDNPRSYLYANTIMSIILDAIVVVLPVPLVARLHMSSRKKKAVCGLFGLGGVVIICSIMRATTVHEASKASDPMWELAPTCLWSLIESCSGVICSCIPALNRPVVIFFEKRFMLSKEKRTRRQSVAGITKTQAFDIRDKSGESNQSVIGSFHSDDDDVERGRYSAASESTPEIAHNARLGWEEFFLEERSRI